MFAVENRRFDADFKMSGLILTVAGPEWLSRLNAASAAPDSNVKITARDPADAVMMLASNPTAYRAVALQEPTAGAWFDTLLDLTLGDTDRPIPLLMLGQPAPQNRLNGTPILAPTADKNDLIEALRLAAIHAKHHASPLLTETFSDADSIRIRYQPIVRLADQRPTSFEILARVQAETGALVGPSSIIAAMVDSDLAVSLSSLILRRALREREENQLDALNLNFALNLPLDAMLHQDLLEILAKLHARDHIQPHSMRLELTETKPVTDLPSISRAIHSLTEAGYKIALDDITPHTTNLDALLDLPFSAVKLDRGVTIGAASRNTKTADRNRAFIQKIASHPGSRAIIAEGIETNPTNTLMKSLGATHGQGYLFARPLPAGALRPWLSQWPMVSEK
jgi:EAL domain-containing protein (putative c-di-GMP-specific phosphodiesterase class I)